jgi:hypothetical protein
MAKISEVQLEILEQVRKLRRKKRIEKDNENSSKKN